MLFQHTCLLDRYLRFATLTVKLLSKCNPINFKNGLFQLTTGKVTVKYYYSDSRTSNGVPVPQLKTLKRNLRNLFSSIYKIFKCCGFKIAVCVMVHIHHKDLFIIGN